jgi:hypothetical protein
MNKKATLLVLASFLSTLVGIAQNLNNMPMGNSPMGSNSMMGQRQNRNEQRDSTQTEIDVESIPLGLRMWKIDRIYGNVLPTTIDTISHHFQNSNLSSGIEGNYNYLGNEGAPQLSRLFFQRKPDSDFIFLDRFNCFDKSPEQQIFINTKSPYTNLTYHSAGNKRDGEERFMSKFAVNVNEHLGFGANFDYLYGRGQYANQSTSFFNFSFLSSYINKNYQIHSILSYNKMKLAENGGIQNDLYITDPIAMSEGKRSYKPSDIPVQLSSTWNRMKGFNFFLSHRYNIGIEKETIERDEEGKEIPKKHFFPITSFIHTVDINRYDKGFISRGEASYFAQDYITGDDADTYTKYVSYKNTLAITTHEGFSKWAKAALSAYISYDHRSYSLPDFDKEKNLYQRNYKENLVAVGGTLSKRKGKTLHYDIQGEIGLTGETSGQFKLDGKMDLNFKLGKDTVRLDAHAYIKNLTPSFYKRHYHSDYAWWDNTDFSKEWRTRVEGTLSIDAWDLSLHAGAENIKNYVYFNNIDLKAGTEEAPIYKQGVNVAQATDNIQIFTASLRKNFTFGIFHLDNVITYQKSSDNEIIPLPELNLYHNLYLKTRLSKGVLALELGADVRYFTKYKAPAYAPAIADYYLQNKANAVDIGGYPIVNVYANLHLKRTRFYAMYYHINASDGNAFLAPHYPINPNMLKIGISWNFFD